MDSIERAKFDELAEFEESENPAKMAQNKGKKCANRLILGILIHSKYEQNEAFLT